MIIGSHNSLSYLCPKKWWMHFIAFTAMCQRENISRQFWFHNVRCFDIHIRYDKEGNMLFVHGPVVYRFTTEEFVEWLEWFNQRKKKDVEIRLILDVRTKWAMEHYDYQRARFATACKALETRYPNIKFWCGRMVKGWKVAYDFDYTPTCEELYGSVMKHKWLWAWFPWLYAVTHNRRNIKKGTDKDILLIDYVNIK